MNYQEFQEQIELISGLRDWKCHDNGSEFSYFRATRNNGQFSIIYAASEYRYDWNAVRRDESMRIEKDCFSLQDAIEFLNMPIVVDDPKSSEGVSIVGAIGILLIGIAIGWISAIATVQGSPNHLHSSTIERT